MKLQDKLIVSSVVFLMLQTLAIAEPDAPTVTETPDAIEIQLPEAKPAASATSPAKASQFDPMTYTLGPDDAIDIAVMRHPEFSGVYPVNQEGKMQYKFVGDMDVNGLTKAELEQRIRDVLSTYVKNPEVNVTVMEYRSKYFYVLGEVGAPGKYYMRSETMPVREAVFEAGLPTVSAAMRKCRLISPSFRGDGKVRSVDLYAILYGGNLKKNINMRPGDVLYVPSTIMAKVIRVINPVASTVGIASSGPTNASSTKTAMDTLSGRPTR
jgi:polysaccharide export outer membrane protein